MARRSTTRRRELRGASSAPRQQVLHRRAASVTQPVSTAAESPTRWSRRARSDPAKFGTSAPVPHRERVGRIRPHRSPPKPDRSRGRRAHRTGVLSAPLPLPRLLGAAGETCRNPVVGGGSGGPVPGMPAAIDLTRRLECGSHRVAAPFTSLADRDLSFRRRRRGPTDRHILSMAASPCSPTVALSLGGSSTLMTSSKTEE